MKIIENTDGLFYWETVDGESVTRSVPFARDQTKPRIVDGVEETYNIYDDLIAQGYELVLIPQAEKDAHEADKAISQAINQVQAMLDSEAQSRGYDNVNAIGKYIGYDNPFRAECEALGAWTAACWAKCYELQSGGSMPSDLLLEMPKFEA